MSDIKEQIKTYFEINEEIKRLEKQLKEIKPTIELFVAKEAQITLLRSAVTVTIGDFAATLTPVERENFKLKEAKEVLNPKMLEPFITTTQYATLKINKLARGSV
jgi:predicted phage-related endonuclease